VKILDKYIIKSFIAPYIISFLVAEFVLVMQFMWKYIDEFAGRGLSFFDFMELLFSFSITMIPMAVPITILIASVMVYGNLSEKYELSSMKSAGISLFRIMKPGFIIAILTFFFSLSVSNYFKPKSQYTFLKFFTQIKKTKPTLNIKEKIFNKDFHGFAIQVDKKHKNGKDIEGVKLYDLNNRSNEEYNIITANKGTISTSEDGRYFIIKLFDGNQYVERKKANKTSKKKKTFPLMRTHFDTLTKNFDLSEFNKQNSSGYFSKKRRDLLNSFQLIKEINTKKDEIVKKTKNLAPQIMELISIDSIVDLNQDKDNEIPKQLEINQEKRITYQKLNLDKINKKRKKRIPYIQLDSIDFTTKDMFIYTFKNKDILSLIHSVQETINYEKNKISGGLSSLRSARKYRDYWILGLNQQYSWALICVIFLFIGAPLGSIIRKGGYGYPVLVAIMFFTVFILLSITGEKLNKSMTFDPIFNAWLPVIVLLPVSIIITMKALTDSKIIDLPQIKALIYKLKKKDN